MQYDETCQYFDRGGWLATANTDRDLLPTVMERPTVVRQDTAVNPAEDQENISVPVTPGMTSEDPNPYSNTFAKFNDQQHPSNSNATGSNEAFQSHRPNSSTSKDAGQPEQLLRQLTSDGQGIAGNSYTEFVSREAHKSLNLSGHVISATFCVPYKISYTPGADWNLHSRHGTSALFDSFSYLASDESPFKHTLVGWTGEIEKSIAPDASQVNGHANSAVNARPINKASAPIPVNGSQPAVINESVELQIPQADRSRLEQQLERDHGGRVAPVWLLEESDKNGDVWTFRDQQRWRRYGEHEIFTLFHYKQNEPNDGRKLRKAWADYYRMNRAFADTIMNVYKPGDVVIIHDYHLLLLPSLLRQRIPNIYISFFLHIPFPSSEYYKCLPSRKELLEGVLGANMIGFQAYSYARHFSSCCTRILGFDSSTAGVDAYGAHVAVDVFPIGINAISTLQSAFENPEVEQKIKALREMYAGKKVIVGRDRLDSIRGVAQKLQAFEIFLARHPEWRGKVVLIQVTSPTSIEDRAEKGDKTANKISELVARINGTFGSLSYTPVQHYPQYLTKEEYFALLRIADLGLITSVRDGMNTTALEYVVCQRDNHGPLIISEFSGTAGSLGDALHINPWDLVGTADTIAIALSMSAEEHQAAHAVLYNRVTTNTIQAWTSKFLERLLINLSSFDQSIATPALDRVKLLAQYKNSSRRLFMFDYDGTLTPIVKDPNSAIPSDRVIRNLKFLASDPQNNVWIISGRDQAFLEEWMGHITELGLSAEHGSFIRHPHSSEWENLTESMDMSWQAVAYDTFEKYNSRTQGAHIERKKIALTWHYRQADPDLGAYQAALCKKEMEDTVVQNYDVEVMSGKANLEVRPRFVNKGEIAKRLVKDYGNGLDKQPDFIFCLGDDFTDEDMFRALNASGMPTEHTFAVTVGASSKQTLAQWHLLEPADVISAIGLLNGQSDGANAGVAAVVEDAGSSEA